MDIGRMSFSAITRLGAGIGESVWKLATCARAWTPASVRPEPCSTASWRMTRATASATVPWTVITPGWVCHPAKSVPSYAITNLKLRAKGLTSPATFVAKTGVLNLQLSFQLQLRDSVVRYTNLFPEPILNLAKGPSERNLEQSSLLLRITG
jgi:hypothetical protein